MDIPEYQFSDGQLQGFANRVKQTILVRLTKDGLLNGDFEKINREYQLVVAKPGWFSKVIDKVFNLKKDVATLIVMKIPADEFEKKEETPVDS